MFDLTSQKIGWSLKSNRFILDILESHDLFEFAEHDLAKIRLPPVIIQNPPTFAQLFLGYPWLLAEREFRGGGRDATRDRPTAREDWCSQMAMVTPRNIQQE